MKWPLNRCRHRRQEISLLAAGALGEEDKGELEHHIAACEECRRYHNGMKAVAAPLANWEKPLSAIEATPVAQMRWARAVRETEKPISVRQPLWNRVWRIVWGELIWPSRRAWAGMAALWLVILAVNGRLADHKTNKAGDSSGEDIMQALREQNHVLADLIGPAMVIPPAPPTAVSDPHINR
jgi:anti-sigma factor RsiW